MVQLTEVPDEHFESGQAGPIEDEGDYTDTGKSCASRHPSPPRVAIDDAKPIPNEAHQESKTKRVKREQTLTSNRLRNLHRLRI